MYNFKMADYSYYINNTREIIVQGDFEKISAFSEAFRMFPSIFYAIFRQFQFSFDFVFRLSSLLVLIVYWLLVRVLHAFRCGSLMAHLAVQERDS